MSASPRILDCLTEIYGARLDARILARLDEVLAKYARIPYAQHGASLSERDAFLITYPDQVQEAGKVPLKSLAEFSAEYVQGLLNSIHLLPFYPSSSDDGFAPIDHRAVSAEYGDWGEVRQLALRYRLMFDGIINHVSSQNSWFQSFLQDDPKYRDYFIRITGTPDLSGVGRPRTYPVLTTFGQRGAQRTVWTTFGPDQIDLNYRDPMVLLEIVEILLYCVARGASFIRMDAVPYLWKEVGTSCVNLPKTHAIIRLIRAVFDELAPDVRLLAEANVPAAENASYLGDGSDEAHMVYNFALAPLVLHAFHTAQAASLGRWAAGLQLPSSGVTWFNVLASHDGIGLNPLRGILSEPEISALVQRVEAGGGLVSRRSAANGTDAPYEINANYLDALKNPGEDQPQNLEVERFLTAHAIMLSFKGVPAMYFHSLFGSRGWQAGVAQTGRPRSINREKLERRQLEKQLRDPGSLRAQIFAGLRRLLSIRSQCPAFSPLADQQVFERQGSILALARLNRGTGDQLLCVYNVSAETQEFDLEGPWSNGSLAGRQRRDLITGRPVEGGGNGSIRLGPFQSLWLTTKPEE